ncbi:hypothetical protein KFK09_019425 [Dendrobium nobile]|uniref:Mitochondrial protein n=1 Tax=Dendrobium nobile TaxID=94219 RepID=A0A8T3AQX3_DENNO|nr:hypothetical protein KFK09_019425 [Dendrobium nobile]
MRLEIEQQIVFEVKKLAEARFIREEQYPSSVASVVPVRKKNGQIRICVDYRDLNKACPKDEFPLPIPELMVDIASSHAIFSFMDGSSGYNQIKMALEDERNTTFRTPIGIFCYKVMPFGLKNAGATYQRAMTRVFDDLIHNQVECNIDDLVVKSKVKEAHLYDLRVVFERLRRYDLKMNPLKCAFGVTSGKFLGFIVRHRGIEINPAKIEAILDMPSPKSLTQLRSLQGRLAYIRRFISNLSGRCQPFSILVKKDTKFIWDEKCQNSFDDIKQYLSNPPVLAAPIPGKPLILYTASLDESLGALLAQVNDKGKENALYYLSRRLLPIEIRYPSIEKHCLALVFAVQKLRHYMLSHPISLILRVNPLQYLMTQPTLSGCLACWSMILLQFEITFIPLRAVKGQDVADFLAAHPLPVDSPLNDDLPNEQIMSLRESGEAIWVLYFDGAASSRRNATQQSIIPRKAGVGLIFITPEKGMLYFSYHLSEPCTNNEAEYEALITGLELAILMEIKVIKIFGDSQLVINQVAGTYKGSRGSNSAEDALAKLAKEFECPEEDSIPIEIQGRKTLSPIDLEHISKNPFQVLSSSSTTDGEGDWRLPLIDYLREGKLP